MTRPSSFFVVPGSNRSVPASRSNCRRLVLTPFAPLFSHRVWLHAQLLLLGAIVAPGARTVTAALRVMGLALERRFTNYHRVLNRAAWSALQGSRMLLGLLLTVLVPPGATIVLGADDTVERRAGRKITAKGCYRDAVRSTKKHVIRCFGLKWVSMMLLVPVPWLVLVVDGGFAAVSLALACDKSRVVMVSRLRWDAALYHRPGLQPPGKRGPKPTK